MVKPVQATIFDAAPSIAHGFFTRKGGVSKGIYEGLNCGFGSNDEKSHVSENRERVARALGTLSENVITPYQKHTNIAAVAKTAWSRENAPLADAVVTDVPRLAVGVLTADCAPVLFADSNAGVVAAAHAGWRGAKAGILKSTVQKMEELGAKRENIVVAIGPALSVEAYEVGPDFKQDFLQDTPENDRFFLEQPSERPHFDLCAYLFHSLKELGVTAIEPLQLCTYNSESLFYSYRRSVHRNESDYGRQISAIMLK